MFNLISKTKHEALLAIAVSNKNAEIATKDSVIAGLKAEVESLNLTNYALDRTAAKYKAQLQPFLDRQEKAKRNLRQFRGSGGIAASADAVTAVNA